MKQQPSFIATGYRYFMAVAEEGSVRAAARTLNVAASAISRQLLMLEQQLGIALFDRGGRSLTISPAGEILFRGLRAAIQGNEQALDQIGALKGLTRGLVRIATVESLSVSILPGMLLAFSEKYPGLEMAVTVAGSDAVTELVREHHADIGFTFNPSSLEGLEVAAARDLALGAVMAPDHPLAKSKHLTLGECLAHRTAWPSPGLSLRAILDSLPAAKKFHPAFECNSLRLMASLARRGNCIAFQTPIGIEQELKAGSLVWIALADKRLPADRLHVVRRQGPAGRPAVDAFLGFAAGQISTARTVRK